MILIICASLPTLGPLFQAAKTKISDGSRGTHGTGNHFEGSAAGSSVGRSRNWDHQKLDSDVGEQASLHMCPSYDAIPLVTTHKKSKLGCGDVDRDQKVYKTVEVKVSSTAHHG